MRIILLFLLTLFAFSFNQSQAQSGGSSVLEELMTDPIYAIEWHPTGDYLAVVTNIMDVQNHEVSGKLSIYDIRLSLVDEVIYDSRINSASWSPNSSELVISSNEQVEILQWDNQAQSLAINSVITTERYPLYALWNPNGTTIAVMELVEFGSPFDDSAISYYISFWDRQTGEQSAITPTPIETIRYFKTYTNSNNEEYGSNFLKFFAWNNEGTEVYTVGKRLDTSYIGFFAINPQTGELAHQFRTEDVPRTLAVRPESDNIYITEEFGVTEYNIETGSPIQTFHNIFDTVLMDWSSDGRYTFVDGYVQTLDDVVGLTDNRDYKSLFAVDWHPYRPIIAIGSLMGRLTIEDATYFERFQASPYHPHRHDGRSANFQYRRKWHTHAEKCHDCE